MSDVPRVDWNDLHVECGLDEVGRQLSEAVTAFQARSVVGGQEAPVAPDNPPVPPAEAYAGDLDDDDHRYRPDGEEWFDRLTRNRHSQIEGHVGNLDLVFANHRAWEGVLAYCDFSYRVLFLRKPPIEHAEPELQDPDMARLRVWFHRNIFTMRPPSRTELQDAVIVASQRQRHHPVRSYLESLRHDGKQRIDTWLRAAFDAAENEDYLRVIGRKFLIGAVARVMQPGCKMETMLILEGDQGKGKSTALRTLFGEFFSDSPLPIGDKDAYQLIHGVWGYEIQEMDSFSRVESTSAKQFMSLQMDRFRPPYGAGVMSFRRQVVFMGTTNQDEYFKDYSGNRRYWPSMCRSVDIDWIKVNRDQLWAEAFAAYKAGAVWWVDSDRERELCEYEQDRRLASDAWETKIAQWLKFSGKDFVTAAEILEGACEIETKHMQRAHQNRVSPIMRALGWRKDRRLVSGERVHGYVRPPGSVSMTPQAPDF